MWDLNHGLKICQSRIKSKIFFLLFFLVGSLFCYSLSPEEVEDLKGLSPEVLINIILIYDKAQTENENDLSLVDEGLMIVLTELMNVRQLQLESEIESALRENLYQMLLSSHDSEMRDEYLRGLKTGITLGSIGGGVVSGTIAIGLSEIKNK